MDVRLIDLRQNFEAGNGILIRDMDDRHADPGLGRLDTQKRL